MNPKKLKGRPITAVIDELVESLWLLDGAADFPGVYILRRTHAPGYGQVGFHPREYLLLVAGDKNEVEYVKHNFCEI